MSDRKFFDAKNCGRCGGDLSTRTMSWFTDETICIACSAAEDIIKRALRERGDDPSSYEGCGYIPKIETKTVKG